MPKHKKPTECEACLEDRKLTWVEDEDMWLCDECQEYMYEEDLSRKYWNDAYLDYLDSDEEG